MQKQKGAKITLYVDAKALQNRFAITDKDGEPIWFGKFGIYDRDYNYEQSSAELCAAKKAVWLANKIRQDNNLSEIHLDLYVDADWLTWANEVANGRKKGGKARALGKKAIKYNIKLNVIWITGRNNPADFYTTGKSDIRWLSYKDANLDSLIARQT